MSTRLRGCPWGEREVTSRKCEGRFDHVCYDCPRVAGGRKRSGQDVEEGVLKLSKVITIAVAAVLVLGSNAMANDALNQMQRTLSSGWPSEPVTLMSVTGLRRWPGDPRTVSKDTIWGKRFGAPHSNHAARTDPIRKERPDGSAGVSTRSSASPAGTHLPQRVARSSSVRFSRKGVRTTARGLAVSAALPLLPSSAALASISHTKDVAVIDESAKVGVSQLL